MLISLGMAAAKKSAKTRLEEQLVLRVDAGLFASLQDGHRVLELLARMNGDDSPGFSGALRRLLRIGLDVTFDKVGGRPKTEADWQALEASLVALKKH